MGLKDETVKSLRHPHIKTVLKNCNSKNTSLFWCCPLGKKAAVYCAAAGQQHAVANEVSPRKSSSGLCIQFYGEDTHWLVLPPFEEALVWDWRTGWAASQQTS